MRRTGQFVALAAIMLLLPAGAAAQNRYWPVSSDRLWRGLEHFGQGAPLLVERTDGDWMKGKLIMVNPGLLTLQRGQRLVDLSRGDVRKIWLFTGRKTGKGARIGAWIGAITGAVAFGSLCHDAGAEKTLCLLATLSFGGTLGAGGGAGVGAVVGSTQRGRRLVYDTRLSSSSAVIPRTADLHPSDRALPSPGSCAPKEFQTSVAAKPCRSFNLEESLTRAARYLADSRDTGRSSLTDGR